MRSDLEVRDFWERYNSLKPEDKDTLSKGYFLDKDSQDLLDKGKNIKWECYHLTHPRN